MSSNEDNDQNIDIIDKFSSLLKFTDSDDEDENYKPVLTDRLKSLDIESFSDYMKTCKNIIFMNGAGISTSAGIPDFRSPKTGLYENLEKYNLPDPQAIFSLDFFKENPRPFYLLSKELMPSNYKPTLSHYFQRLLVDMNQVKKIYTQNIDNLESMTNIPLDKIVNAHGSFRTGHCLSCNKEYTFEWMKKTIHEKEYLKCDNQECLKNSKNDDNMKIVKPDIIFFGEEMPKEFFNYPIDFADCDCLIVVGTSLKVHPFSMLTKEVKRDIPRLLINRDLVGDWEMYKNYPEYNYRDLYLLGDCDDMCLKLADLLGLKNDLLNLIKSENDKFDMKK